ncbi:MAG: hypothetical protein R2847_04955 [Bacteroidia bacterium]
MEISANLLARAITFSAQMPHTFPKVIQTVVSLIRAPYTLSDPLSGFLSRALPVLCSDW